MRRSAPKDMVFAATGAGPVDAPAWPTQADVWLQPAVAPAPPAWSGLTIERRHRIPVPGFVRSGATPLDRPAAAAFSGDAIASAAQSDLPISGLAPLGWDARAICRKEGGE